MAKDGVYKNNVVNNCSVAEYGNVLGANGERYHSVAECFADGNTGCELKGNVIERNKLILKDKVLNLPDLNCVVIEMHHKNKDLSLMDGSEIQLTNREELLIFHAMNATISLIDEVNKD